MPFNRIIIFILISIITATFTNSAEIVFSEVQRIKISTPQYYPVIKRTAPVSDGFIVAFCESASGNNPLLVKLDKMGSFISKYDARGHGPGELNSPDGISAHNGEIFVGEFYTPVVHVFTDKLEFKKDYRIKDSGRVLFANEKYVGIWSMHYTDDLVYLLSLYDRKSFAHKKDVFPVRKDEIPAFVQHYGNVVPMNEHNFIGVYSSDFQIKLFNQDFDLKGTLIKSKPDHVKKYRPWKKSRSKINVKEAEKWLSTWTVAHSVLRVDNHFIINYEEAGAFYLDVMDREGHFLLTGYKVKWFHAFSDGKYLYRYSEKETSEDDIPLRFLIKEKLMTGTEAGNND